MKTFRIDNLLASLLLAAIMFSCDEAIEPQNKQQEPEEDFTVTSITPADKAAGVDPETDVIVNFNKPIDLSTVSNSTFWISNTKLTTNEYGTITQTGSVATLKLDNALEEGATYEFGLTTGIKTKAGEALDQNYLISFTIKEPEDNQPPAITSYSITNGYQFVNTDDNIEVNFSESVLESSASGISLRNLENGNNVAIDLEFSGTTVTVMPKEEMFGNSEHELTIPGTVEDLNGNSMGSSSKLSFGTRNNGFTVSTFYPENGAKNVKINETIKVSFERDIDASTVDENTVKIWQIDPDGNGYEEVSGSYDVDGNLVEFIPTEPLREFENEYYVVVTGVKDLRNNKSDDPMVKFNTEKVSLDYSYYIRAFYADNIYLTYNIHHDYLFMASPFINHNQKKWKFEKNSDNTYGILSIYKGEGHAIAGNTADDGVKIFLGTRPNSSQWYSDQLWAIDVDHTSSDSRVTFSYKETSGSRFNYSLMDVSNEYREYQENYFKLVRADQLN